jgi:IS30 family transposase
MVDLDRLAELIRGSTAARGVDVYAVEECGLSAAKWAEMTGRDRSTVARNVRRGSN